MTPEEFDLLCDPASQELIDRHIGDDPVRLSLSLKCERERAVAVCNQIKYLQRCRMKLPDFYQKRCVLPALSYQQSSSAASAKRKDYSGGLCIDLTCGLGADAYYFSKRFERVITLEKDPLLARIASYNFAELGAENITVISGEAGEFLRSYRGQTADLVYADPARRNEGKKVFLMEDCSPDITRILPDMFRIGRTAVVKLSPLFDVKELQRVFSEYLRRTIVISVGNECREVVAELKSDPTDYELVVSTDSGNFSFQDSTTLSHTAGGKSEIGNARFLLVPDTGFYKSRSVGRMFSQYHPHTPVYLPDENGFAFADKFPEGFAGKVYRILFVREFQPKILRKHFREKGIRRINFLRRNFPLSTDELKKQLGVSEGGAVFIAFVADRKRRYALTVEPEK